MRRFESSVLVAVLAASTVHSQWLPDRSSLWNKAVAATALSRKSNSSGAHVRPLLPLVQGVDVSFLDEIERHGGIFKENGIPGDALTILRHHGINTVRLRLFHSPSGGVNDLNRTMMMARRIRQLGMQFLLDFHYSDTWADPGQQSKPMAWSSLSFPSLRDSVYGYTRRVIAHLQAQNTLPDIVQVGNEITCGLLWNDGRVCESYNTGTQWARLVELLADAIRGVKSAERPGDSVRVMVHIDRGGDSVGSKWFLDKLIERGLAFDLIGLSYYPWWHGTMNQLSANLAMLSSRYAKDIIVVETAYPWTLAWNDSVGNIVGLPGQLHPGYPASVDGQSAFLSDLLAIIRTTPNGRGGGLVYWSPEYISVPGLGSVWENVTLFDFEGELLRSIEAFEPPTASPGGQDAGTASPRFALEQNFPNPVNQGTSFVFSVPSGRDLAGGGRVPGSELVTLKVFDVLGREVATLVDELKSPGTHSIGFDASRLVSGVYFYRLEAGDIVRTRKLVLQK